MVRSMRSCKSCSAKFKVPSASCPAVPSPTKAEARRRAGHAIYKRLVLNPFNQRARTPISGPIRSLSCVLSVLCPWGCRASFFCSSFLLCVPCSLSPDSTPVSSHSLAACIQWRRHVTNVSGMGARQSQAEMFPVVFRQIQRATHCSSQPWGLQQRNACHAQKLSHRQHMGSVCVKDTCRSARTNHKVTTKRPCATALHSSALPTLRYVGHVSLSLHHIICLSIAFTGACDSSLS